MFDPLTTIGGGGTPLRGLPPAADPDVVVAKQYSAMAGTMPFPLALLMRRRVV